MLPSQFHQVRAQSFETSSEVNVFNSKSCIKMATTYAYMATGIKFQRKRDTGDVSKVRRTFLRFVLTGEGREVKKKTRF